MIVLYYSKYMKVITILLIFLGLLEIILADSFKNFRRDHPVDECSPRRARENDQGPPSKRLKTVLTDDDDNMIQDDDEYEEVVRDLKHEWKKGKNHGAKQK